MVLRVLAGAVGLLCAVFVVRTFAFTKELGVLGLVLLLSFSTMAILLLWYAFQGHHRETAEILRLGFRGGLIVGVTGFVIGFVGPIIFMRDSNLGPLLGILMTGPGGFAIGVIGGIAYALVRRRGRQRNSGARAT